MAVVAACGRVRVTRYTTPCGVQDNPVGLGDQGNDPVALAQTRCPGARVARADHDCVPLVVPGGPGLEAQCDRVGVRPLDLVGPVTSIAGLDAARAKRLVEACGGCQAAWRLIATLRPMWRAPGRPAALVLGAC